MLRAAAALPIVAASTRASRLTHTHTHTHTRAFHSSAFIKHTRVKKENNKALFEQAMRVRAVTQHLMRSPAVSLTHTLCSPSCCVTFADAEICSRKSVWVRVRVRVCVSESVCMWVRKESEFECQRSRVLRNVFETFLLISRTLSVCLTYTDERESAGIACKYKYSNFECGA